MGGHEFYVSGFIRFDVGLVDLEDYAYRTFPNLRVGKFGDFGVVVDDEHKRLALRLGMDHDGSEGQKQG